MQSTERRDQSPTIPPLPNLIDPYQGQSWAKRRQAAVHRNTRWEKWVPTLPWRVAILFLLLVVLSNLVLDALGGDLAVNSDSWGAVGQITACERQSATPDIVIMGSSRAQAGVSPTALSGEVGARLHQHIVACDMAVTTSVPMQDYFMLRRLLADGVRPRFLIYATADYEFNTPIAETNPPVRDNVQYVAHLTDLPALLQSHIGDARRDQPNAPSWYGDFIAGRLVRFYADRRGFQIAFCKFAPTFGPCPGIIPVPPVSVASPATPLRTYPVDVAHGWYPLPEATQRSLDNSRWQYTGWLAKYQVAPDAIDYLGKLVDLARANHIGMVLLNTPILPRHLAFFPKPADYLTYLDTLHTFSQVYNVPFYDEGLGYDDNLTDFADTNHLNYWGALQFSGWLGIHVVVPEYQRQVLGRGWGGATRTSQDHWPCHAPSSWPTLWGMTEWMHPEATHGNHDPNPLHVACRPTRCAPGRDHARPDDAGPGRRAG